PVKTRWLATQHKTLDLDDVKAATTPEQRAHFAKLAEKLRGKSGAFKLPTPAPASAPAPVEVPTPEEKKLARAVSGGAKPRKPAAPVETDEPEEEGEEAATDEGLETLKPRLVELLN